MSFICTPIPYDLVVIINENSITIAYNVLIPNIQTMY